MDKLYRLKSTVGPVEPIDLREQLTGLSSPALDKGTEFRIFRPKHEWSIHPSAQRYLYYTIQVNGKHYNVLANVLDPAMEQLDPPLRGEK